MSSFLIDLWWENVQKFTKIQFPDDFSLSVNPTHFSNTDESLKILQEIIIPYLEKQRIIENLVFDHPALLIFDVFKGQLTEPVSNELKDHHIFTCQLPSSSHLT